MANPESVTFQDDSLQGPGWWFVEVLYFLAALLGLGGLLGGVLLAIKLPGGDPSAFTIGGARLIGGAVAGAGAVIALGLMWAALVLRCLGDLVIISAGQSPAGSRPR